MAKSLTTSEFAAIVYLKYETTSFTEYHEVSSVGIFVGSRRS
jgi:hypothetical protein